MSIPIKFVRAFYTLPTKENTRLDHLGHVALFFEVGEGDDVLRFNQDHISITRAADGRDFNVVFPGRYNSAAKRRYETLGWPSRDVRLAAEEAVRRTVEGAMRVISFDLSSEEPLTPRNGFGRVVCRFSDIAERDNFEFRTSEHSV